MTIEHTRNNETPGSTLPENKHDFFWCSEARRSWDAELFFGGAVLLTWKRFTKSEISKRNNSGPDSSVDIQGFLLNKLANRAVEILDTQSHVCFGSVGILAR